MFKELVLKARTFRRFVENEPLSRETLRQLVDIARFVPCGGNQQPLRYRVADSSEREKVFPHLAWAAALKGWGGPAAGERPAGYIVILSDAEKTEPAHDVGIAAYALQLAAADLGYGACMLGSVRREALHASLNLPAQWAIRLVVALGRPAETVTLEDPRPDGSLTYYRSAGGSHHVPKRRLADIFVE